MRALVCRLVGHDWRYGTVFIDVCARCDRRADRAGLARVMPDDPHPTTPKEQT